LSVEGTDQVPGRYIRLVLGHISLLANTVVFLAPWVPSVRVLACLHNYRVGLDRLITSPRVEAGAEAEAEAGTKAGGFATVGNRVLTSEASYHSVGRYPLYFEKGATR